MGSDYDSDGKLKAGIDPTKDTEKVAEIKSKNVNELYTTKDVVFALDRIERLLEKLIDHEERIGGK